MANLAPKFALVTGGAGDIGGAIVARLSADGFTTTIVDTIDEPAGAARARALSVNAPVTFCRASTTSRQALTALIATLPRLDLAVMCAGTVSAQPFLDIDDAAWQLQLDVNLTGSFLAAQIAARRMRKDASRGHLIFISSWVASRPWPEIAAYSSSKAGIDQLMRQAALELAPHGIRSNSVAPGIVMAGLAKTQFETEPQYAARASRSIPLGAPQTADQIADAVGFLASPAAATMTGSILTVDAGSTLGTLA
ncbi:SDR family NAD(P)-dependent oxidoreductase [Glaciihabitans sp. INWT7]|uniref:SDR family NAD(P)-dependent oxidoreductase n=1 Tax=Glaciihabitans sp. INWT7 TaxID=2596912 RepID=UPI001C64276C|nr:SDR family oxidoreductase [Glaciihabitans sp. INWT7]